MTNKQKQCLLCYLGLYGGAIDGIWGKQSRQAEAAFRRERGLRDEDILEDALRKAVAEAPEDWWSGIAHFRREEFACKCGRYCDGWPAEMDRTVVEAAENGVKVLAMDCRVSEDEMVICDPVPVRL